MPNARRDGFEDDENWRAMRKELASVCGELGRQAYDVSKKNQHSVRVLARESRDLEVDAKNVLESDAPPADKLIDLSTNVNKLQRRVSRALRHADFEVTGQLQSLANRLMDVKTKAVRKLGATQLEDPDEIRAEAQNEVVALLMRAFKEQLNIATYSRVRRIVEEALGRSDF